MKLRNKKTGEIVDNILEVANRLDNGKNTFTLAEINAEWEDYEEPKGYWFVNDLDGEPMKCELRYCPVRDFAEWSVKRKKIGNYFETREEAEKAVENLKAWKRLKENKVHFDLATLSDENVITIFARKKGEIHKYDKELDLLFGGEE